MRMRGPCSLVILEYVCGISTEDRTATSLRLSQLWHLPPRRHGTRYQRRRSGGHHQRGNHHRYVIEYLKQTKDTDLSKFNSPTLSW